MSLPQCQPMPLARMAQPFDHPDFVFEAKYDGFRALAYVDGDCRLVSRKGNVLRAIVSKDSRLLYAAAVPKCGIDLYRAACEMDLEGIVAKLAQGPYRACGHELGEDQESELQPGRRAARIVRAAPERLTTQRGWISRGDLSRTTLSETRLFEADLSQADLLMARTISGADLRGAHLNKAILGFEPVLTLIGGCRGNGWHRTAG